MAEAMWRARERERETERRMREGGKSEIEGMCECEYVCVCARLCLCLCLRVCLCACVFMFVSLNVYAKVCGIAHEAGSYKYTPCVHNIIYIHNYMHTCACIFGMCQHDADFS